MKVHRLFDCIYRQQEVSPLQRCMGSRSTDGNWQFYSTQEVIDASRQLASGLLSLGVKPGDKIAIAAYKNRPEWTIADMATQQIGVINVPVYPTISPREYEYIFQEAEVKHAFVGGGDLYEKVAAAGKNLAGFEKIFTFDQQEGRAFWKDIFDENNLAEVDRIKDSIQTDDLATIIYTSGTTGNPKGVMLTHSNVVFVVTTTQELLLDINAGDRALSFLPLCHIFERAVYFGYLYKGLSIYFTGTDNLGGDEGDLKSAKPHFFTTVPRLLEKVYEAIYGKGLALSGIKRKLFFWALSLTEDYEYDKTYGGLKGLQWKIADKLIFSKWREGIGGHIRGIVTGASACPRRIAQVFSAAGIPIREGYGLTETSPTISVNLFKPGLSMLGSVGPVIKGVDVQIDPTEGEYKENEGEILCKGPNVMQGYYRQPEKTAAVFKEINGERWFRTGDVGKLVTTNGQQFLKITDRKKELLKTSGGKYVAPAPIENKLKENMFVEQAMVIGEKRKFVSALIVPAEDALKDWCSKKNIEWTSMAEVSRLPEIQHLYQKVIDQINPQFSHIEQIKKFRLIASSWEPVREDGTEPELTPTMKLKRRVIREKYGQDIQEIYD